MFTFSEIDTRIFQYSKGERNPDGSFKAVYADPAVIKRSLDIFLPNRIPLVDQFLGGVHVKEVKARDVASYEQDPDAYMAMIVSRDHGYQASIPNPNPDDLTTGAIPNPETPAQFAKRMGVQPPTEFSPEEMAAIKMGGIAHQNLCMGLRAAFDLPELNEATGEGTTDYMVIAVWNHYQDWLEKKSGNMPPTPTSSPPSPEA